MINENNIADKVTLSVSEIEESAAGILTAPGEIMSPVDVHIEGVAEGNTTPIPVTIQALLPTGLNAGNYKLYHVEDGNTVEMTLRAAGQAPTHNTFDYDSATGDVILYLASFSEVVVQANTENPWQGYMDFSWYEYAMPNEEGVLVYKISNADQLAAFGAIVGGMKVDMKGNAIPYEQDSFDGNCVVTLVSDIYIGDLDSENEFMFYPIGYYNSTGSYKKESGGSVTSGFIPFKGTFDGCGHTISSFYQNTWEAFGDYNDGYSGTPNHNRDGFGLFGKVWGSREGEKYTGGIIRNLTVNNFSSDGEFGTTGAIAAYAENQIPAMAAKIKKSEAENWSMWKLESGSSAARSRYSTYGIGGGFKGDEAMTFDNAVSTLSKNLNTRISGMSYVSSQTWPSVSGVPSYSGSSTGSGSGSGSSSGGGSSWWPW